jgi:hypothetical protein
MTFDDYIIKLDRTDHDWWVDIKWQIDAWNEGGKDFPESLTFGDQQHLTNRRRDGFSRHTRARRRRALALHERRT